MPIEEKYEEQREKVNDELIRTPMVEEGCIIGSAVLKTQNEEQSIKSFYSMLPTKTLLVYSTKSSIDINENIFTNVFRDIKDFPTVLEEDLDLFSLVVCNDIYYAYNCYTKIPPGISFSTDSLFYDKESDEFYLSCNFTFVRSLDLLNIDTIDRDNILLYISKYYKDFRHRFLRNRMKKNEGDFWVINDK